MNENWKLVTFLYIETEQRPAIHTLIYNEDRRIAHAVEFYSYDTVWGQTLHL